MRFLLLFTLSLLSINASAQTLRLENDPSRFVDHLKIMAGDTNFGGVSGIEYVQDRNKWYFITDGHGDARQSYLFEIEGSARDSFPQFENQNAIELKAVTELSQTEAIRFDSKRFWICTEENVPHPDSSGIIETGSIARLDDKGGAVEAALFKYGSKFENRGYEALALAGSDTVCIINEWPSKGDGRYARLKLMTFTGDTTRILGEYAYEIDINSCVSEKDTVDGNRGNGISEMLYIDNGRFLMLERCFDGERGFVKIYETRISSDNTNVAEPEFKELANAGAFRPLPKQEVFNFNSIKDLKIDNLEGMAWGPGRKTIAVISDNNYRKKTDKQKTQWIVLKVVN